MPGQTDKSQDDNVMDKHQLTPAYQPACGQTKEVLKLNNILISAELIITLLNVTPIRLQPIVATRGEDMLDCHRAKIFTSNQQCSMLLPAVTPVSRECALWGTVKHMAIKHKKKNVIIKSLKSCICCPTSSSTEYLQCSMLRMI